MLMFLLSGHFPMRSFPHLLVCEHCDSVYGRPHLAPGEVARCTRCDALLCRGRDGDVAAVANHLLALTAAAAILFVIANVCPVVRISMRDLHSEATLWQATFALAHGPAAPIAPAAALVLIVVPFLQIILLGWVLLHARTGRSAPHFARAMRLLGCLRPWSMVEVGLLGILIAVIKLAGFVQVAPGAGVWATAGLTLLLPLMTQRDTQWLWELYDRTMRPAAVVP